ncbi:MAG: HAMP domain-containing sensor histidine kinase [Candidatus Omnitrophota bacterium]|nr:HAMP domain-containing histidine kinase [Candidatus Omnitrophota bacterium]
MKRSEQKDRRIIQDKIITVSVTGFILLIFVAWFGEVFDLSNTIFGLPRTPLNWREALIETVFITVIGAFTLNIITKNIEIRHLREKDLKDAKEDLTDKNKELNQANDEKNKFLGIAAHDLRSPISIIQTALFILKDEFVKTGSKGASRMAEVIEKQSGIMKNLVDELLDVSKIESGRMVLDKRKEDYVKFIKECIEFNQFIAGKKGIEITVAAERDIPELYFDRERVNQLINNLIDNAVKYSYRGSSVSIEITKNEKKVITKVIDQGVGISKEDISNIFREFYKTNVGPTENEHQTGLGLAIAKKIAEGHGGEIGVNSRIGEGSTFYFSLPL